MAYHLDDHGDDHQSRLLGIAMKGLPVGTAYSIWVGVGAVGTVILGILLLGESASVSRMISVVLIIGLKISTA